MFLPPQLPPPILRSPKTTCPQNFLLPGTLPLQWRLCQNSSYMPDDICSGLAVHLLKPRNGRIMHAGLSVTFSNPVQGPRLRTTDNGHYKRARNGFSLYNLTCLADARLLLSLEAILFRRIDHRLLDLVLIRLHQHDRSRPQLGSMSTAIASKDVSSRPCSATASSG